MLKKLIALFLIVSVFTVQANASTNQGLKAAFNELNYSLTTEWDQKDKSFYESKMKEFTATLRDLQSKGLTSAQFIDFARSEIKDAQAAKDFETAMSMVAINNMSVEEASNYVHEVMKKSYSSGASWVGEALGYVGASLFLLGFIFLIATAPVSNGCYGPDVVSCTPVCYNDYYYGYSCYDECYSTPTCF